MGPNFIPIFHKIDLFNENKETFGYDRIKEIFLLHAQKPVNEIISALYATAEEWMNGQQQNDDITLIAFRLI